MLIYCKKLLNLFIIFFIISIKIGNLYSQTTFENFEYLYQYAIEPLFNQVRWYKNNKLLDSPYHKQLRKYLILSNNYIYEEKLNFASYSLKKAEYELLDAKNFFIREYNIPSSFEVKLTSTDNTIIKAYNTHLIHNIQYLITKENLLFKKALFSKKHINLLNKIKQYSFLFKNEKTIQEELKKTKFYEYIDWLNKINVFINKKEPYVGIQNLVQYLYKNKDTYKDFKNYYFLKFILHKVIYLFKIWGYPKVSLELEKNLTSISKNKKTSLHIIETFILNKNFEKAKKLLLKNLKLTNLKLFYNWDEYLNYQNLLVNIYLIEKNIYLASLAIDKNIVQINKFLQDLTIPTAKRENLAILKNKLLIKQFMLDIKLSNASKIKNKWTILLKQINFKINNYFPIIFLGKTLGLPLNNIYEKNPNHITEYKILIQLLKIKNEVFSNTNMTKKLKNLMSKTKNTQLNHVLYNYIDFWIMSEELKTKNKNPFDLLIKLLFWDNSNIYYNTGILELVNPNMLNYFMTIFYDYIKNNNCIQKSCKKYNNQEILNFLLAYNTLNNLKKNFFQIHTNTLEQKIMFYFLLKKQNYLNNEIPLIQHKNWVINSFSPSFKKKSFTNCDHNTLCISFFPLKNKLYYFSWDNIQSTINLNKIDINSKQIHENYLKFQKSVNHNMVHSQAPIELGNKLTTIWNHIYNSKKKYVELNLYGNSEMIPYELLYNLYTKKKQGTVEKVTIFRKIKPTAFSIKKPPFKPNTFQLVGISLDKTNTSNELNDIKKNFSIHYNIIKKNELQKILEINLNKNIIFYLLQDPSNNQQLQWNYSFNLLLSYLEKLPPITFTFLPTHSFQKSHFNSFHDSWQSNLQKIPQFKNSYIITSFTYLPLKLRNAFFYILFYKIIRKKIGFNQAFQESIIKFSKVHPDNILPYLLLIYKN